jgi:hypothetical protein
VIDWGVYIEEGSNIVAVVVAVVVELWDGWNELEQCVVDEWKKGGSEVLKAGRRMSECKSEDRTFQLLETVA